MKISDRIKYDSLSFFINGNKKPRVKTRGSNQNQLLRKKIIEC